MEFIVITGPNYEKALHKINYALTLYAGIELRLDLFQQTRFKEIEKIINLCKKLNKKVIVTKRSKRSGGGYKGCIIKLKEELIAIDHLSPDYIDLESFLSDDFFTSISNAKIIASHHDFKHTPRNLDSTLKCLRKKNVYAYKLCTTALDVSDSYRMLNFIYKQKKSNNKFIGLCMGDAGKPTRMSGISAGNYLNYRILNISDKVSEGMIFA